MCIWSNIFFLVILFSWAIASICVSFSDYKIDLYIDDLFYNPPLDFINVYFNNVYSSSISTNHFNQNVYTNYSSQNVKVPISINTSSKIYNYDDFPDIFLVHLAKL